MIYTPKYKTFNFKGWHIDANKIAFNWQFDEEIEFEEIIIWPQGTVIPENTAIKEAADLFLLIAGISYYKSYPTLSYELNGIKLVHFKADFLNKIYTQGLGEYLYKNELDPKIIGEFKANELIYKNEASKLNLSGISLLIGGGKDSLVSADILNKAGIEFTSFRVNSLPWIDRQIDKIGNPNTKIQRIMDQKIINSQLEGALNGHVPVTAIVSVIAVLDAIINNHQIIITSNEASANIGNTKYRGLDINHQFSKSLDFETDFSKYIETYIDARIKYFSLLRPWSEIKIAKYFAINLFDKFSKIWSSSNHNFKYANSSKSPSWDLTSPKTKSVFGLLSPFVERGKLIKEFENKNLFENISKDNVWLELIGQKGIKPFECVADTLEMNWALNKAYKSGSWPELAELNLKDTNYDPLKNLAHRIPDEFVSLVS